ncbi:MAG TPA: nuclear transport factor 2 family protein [Vicinamibacterales bacterium]|nr:nuclear transport factor 2 family protein [Vicinamibacterales bacterium]
MSSLTKQDRDQIRTMVEKTWVNACLRSDWNAAIAQCTEDVSYMPADTPMVRGRNELKGFLNDFPQLLEFSQTLLDASGDSSLAAVQATFAGSFTVDGQKLAGSGKVLATATKEDGHWLFSAVCFNWDAPPAPVA